VDLVARRPIPLIISMDQNGQLKVALFTLD
jgi:hypothetical protein